MNEIILDVRERDEFDAEHIENSINVPLSHFASTAPGVLNQLKQRNVTVMCRGGNRAKLAMEQIRQLGFADKVDAKVYDGGIMAWKSRGLPTIAKRRHHLPILRQVQLVAGALVLTGIGLGVFLNPLFLGISAFVGAGLMVAGATGFCGMAILLGKMPWNIHVPSTGEEICQISPKAGGCN